MKTIIKILLLSAVVGCGAEPLPEADSVSWELTLDEGRNCTGIMTARVTHEETADALSGSWTCGELSGPFTGSISHGGATALILNGGAYPVTVDGSYTTGEIVGTAHFWSADVSFRAR